MALELLFNMNANIKSFNKAQQTPLDLAAPLCDVWELLHEEAEWRNLLERPRPCRVSLVRQPSLAEPFNLLSLPCPAQRWPACFVVCLCQSAATHVLSQH